ncbi:uncharacterized protein LOC127856638 [Dreissena polymorpha]|uniref:uncharacterized protein LOC127856638 n=1 Tax=Dreissena polymorpha TaxID=45954 RepID=UPI0022652979|nr:uncharacterized protein LOC127856638 [Dreissena polymorpha]
MRRPGTGGGPRVKEFTIPEGILLEHFGDSASLAGVPNAIDTDAPEGTLLPSIIDLGKIPTDGATSLTFTLDERGAQKTSCCVSQLASVDEAGPCSSGTRFS